MEELMKKVCRKSYIFGVDPFVADAKKLEYTFPSNSKRVFRNPNN
jgi:hypothetical protein